MVIMQSPFGNVFRQIRMIEKSFRASGINQIFKQVEQQRRMLESASSEVVKQVEQSRRMFGIAASGINEVFKQAERSRRMFENLTKRRDAEKNRRIEKVEVESVNQKLSETVVVSTETCEVNASAVGGGGGGDSGDGDGDDDDDGEPPIWLLGICLASILAFLLLYVYCPEWRIRFAPILNSLAGACGGMTRFVYSCQRRYYRNNFVRRFLYDFIGGTNVGTFLSLQNYFVLPLAFPFSLGLCWRKIVAQHRPDYLKKLRISLAGFLRKMAVLIEAG